MFDLEPAIKEWRRQMAAGGIKRTNILDELESHLRDDVSQQVRAGSSVEYAFGAAVQQIGNAATVRHEFKKISLIRRLDAKSLRFMLTLAGVPNQYLETSPRTFPAGSEPGWATYLRSAAMFAPGAFLLSLTVLYLVPWVQFLFKKSHFNSLPDMDRGLVLIYRANLGVLGYCKDHFFLIPAIILAGLALIEWRFKNWPRYRRAVLSSFSFLLNLLILGSIFLLFLVALIAAQALLQPNR